MSNGITLEQVSEFLKSCDHEDLGHVLDVCGNRLIDYRAEHNGWVPKPCFLPQFKVAGHYVALEIIAVFGGKPVLKKRGNFQEISAAHWEKKLQIPGGAYPYRSGAEGLVMASLGEFFEGTAAELLPRFVPRLKEIGVEIHYEPSRSCDCVTLLFVLPLELEEIEILKGGIAKWIVVEKDDPRVIFHQQNTLEVFFYNQPEFFLQTLPSDLD